MLLQLSTWLEVESYLEQSQGIIIPIGSTEQHQAERDLLVQMLYVLRQSLKEWGTQVRAMVAPTLNVGIGHTSHGFSRYN
jgi:creatinine amidohydrolase